MFILDLINILMPIIFVISNFIHNCILSFKNILLCLSEIQHRIWNVPRLFFPLLDILENLIVPF